MRETSSGDGRRRMTNRGRGPMPGEYDWEQMPGEYNWGPAPGGDDWGSTAGADDWSQEPPALADDWRQAPRGWTQGPARGNRGPVPGPRGGGPGPARGSGGTRAGGYERGPQHGVGGARPMTGRGGGPQGGGYGPGSPRGGYPRGPRGAGYDTGPMPVEYDTGPMPAGYDSGPMPAAFDSGPMPAASDSGQVTAGFSRPPRTSGYERGPGAAGGGRGRTAAPAGRGLRTAGGPPAAGRARGPARSGKGGKGNAKTGALIITVVSLAAAFFVIFVLGYDMTAQGRSKSEQAAFLAPVTNLGSLASQYQSIAQTANNQLIPNMNSYNANERSNLTAARSALLGQVATGRTFDDNLSNWVTDWQQNYAAAQKVKAEASFPVSVPYPSSVAATAQALIRADQAREGILVEQSQATTLRQMQSLNAQQQAAGAAIQAQDTLLRKALHLPPA